MMQETKDKQPSLGRIALDWWSGLQVDSGKAARRAEIPVPWQDFAALILWARQWRR